MDVLEQFPGLLDAETQLDEFVRLVSEYVSVNAAASESGNSEARKMAAEARRAAILDGFIRTENVSGIWTSLHNLSGSLFREMQSDPTVAVYIEPLVSDLLEMIRPFRKLAEATYRGESDDDNGNGESEDSDSESLKAQAAFLQQGITTFFPVLAMRGESLLTQLRESLPPGVTIEKGSLNLPRLAHGARVEAGMAATKKDPTKEVTTSFIAYYLDGEKLPTRNLSEVALRFVSTPENLVGVETLRAMVEKANPGKKWSSDEWSVNVNGHTLQRRKETPTKKTRKAKTSK